MMTSAQSQLLLSVEVDVAVVTLLVSSGYAVRYTAGTISLWCRNIYKYILTVLLDDFWNHMSFGNFKQHWILLFRCLLLIIYWWIRSHHHHLLSPCLSCSTTVGQNSSASAQIPCDCWSALRFTCVFCCFGGDEEIRHRILPLPAGKGRFRGGVSTHPRGFSLLFQMPFILHQLLSAHYSAFSTIHSMFGFWWRIRAHVQSADFKCAQQTSLNGTGTL